MFYPGNLIRLFIVALVFAVFSFGCQTVPKEVVELSYLMGEDLESLNSSYEKLIHQYYENLRDQRRAYLDDVWYPRFISNWREEGELVAIVKEERIWSDQKQSFVTIPVGSAPEESLKTLEAWLMNALNEYEHKEKELLEPLDNDEERLAALVKQAFTNATRANATITAHLNSIREVQEVQDETLKALNLKELRDEINRQLIDASKRAKSGLEMLEKADANAEKITRKLELK